MERKDLLTALWGVLVAAKSLMNEAASRPDDDGSINSHITIALELVDDELSLLDDKGGPRG